MDPNDLTRPHAGRARDDALRRASTLTKWIGVGAVTLAGGLAGFVAQAKPGHSTTSGSAARAPGASRTSAAAPSPAPSAGGGSEGSGSVAPSPSIAPPPVAPAPAPSSSGVVSGGS